MGEPVPGDPAAAEDETEWAYWRRHVRTSQDRDLQVRLWGKAHQQPLPAAPVWPVHHKGFVFGPAAPAGVAPAEPEDAKETAVERPELETGAEGEGDEAGAEDEQKPEDVWQVAPQLATPAKLPPAVLDAEACSKTPPGEDHESKVARRHSEQGWGVEAECSGSDGG